MSVLSVSGGAKVSKNVCVVETDAVKVLEYVGRVASEESRLSACVVTRKEASEEPYQCPMFDEYILVLQGCMEMVHEDETVTVVEAGCGAMLPANTRVKWRWPGKCTYVPICVPAFSPDLCKREDDSEAVAKEREQLHYKSLFPYVYHVALKDRWESARNSNETYYPPTFEKDGKFTHATADPARLIEVLNHFYKNQPGEWLCLQMTVESLEAEGVKTVFESAAPVGSVPAIGGDQLFPHILGGIPPSAVSGTMPVLRNSEDGTFLNIRGLTDNNEYSKTNFSSNASRSLSHLIHVTLGSCFDYVLSHQNCSSKDALFFLGGLCLGIALASIRR